MADIATVFNWSPSVMSEMHLEELIQWRERARVRMEVDER